jgi:hypothetical protein
VEPERTLTDSQRDEFEDMQRALTLERSQIKEAMGLPWIMLMQLESNADIRVKSI